MPVGKTFAFNCDYMTMSLPPVDPLPEEVPSFTPPESQPPRPASVRRRRSRRLIIPRDAGARAEFLEALARLTAPTLSFYLVSVLAGLLVAAAIVLDSPALFILAALLAPFMGPVVGLSLAAVLGSLGFFLRSLVGLLVGGALVFAMGALGGVISLQFPDLKFSQVLFHTQFTWADLVVLLLGASLTAYLLVRSQNKPLASSVALAYEIYLPLGAAGFGLVTAQPGLFPDGLLLFASHLAMAVLVGILVMALLGLRPLSLVGYTAGTSIFLVVLAAVLALTGIGQAILSNTTIIPVSTPIPSLPPAPPTVTLTASPLPSSATPLPAPSQTPTLPPTLAPTRTPTLVLTPTHTETLAPSPTPVWGMVNAGEANGVIIRPEPGSLEQVTSLLNGNLIQILPEVVNRGGVIWLHVRTVDGKEGWVQSVLIVTATPRPR